MLLTLILWSAAVTVISALEIEQKNDHNITQANINYNLNKLGRHMKIENDSVRVQEVKNEIDSVIVVDTADNDTENRDDEEDKDESDETEDLATVHPEVIHIVETTYGPVKGYLSESYTLGYYDVPYGKIDAYFQPPSEPDVWTEAREITEHASICPQLRNGEVIGDLECLTLSIFVPSGVKNAGVLFYIHGAGDNFQTGSGNPSIYGPEYLISKKVILVLPNYRLGSLGFLCLQNEYIPGNAALKDLKLALEWTSNNIAAFGGNPNNIVISGDGLSGVLAEYLALYPISSIYINKVITDSGSVLSPLAMDREPLITALGLARSIYNDSSASDVNILRETEYRKLIKHSEHLKFKPCLEKTADAFMNITVWELLHEETIEKPFMIGSANHAGLHEYVELTKEIIEEINENYRHLLPLDLSFRRDWQKTDAANNIKKQYFGNEDVSLAKIEQLTLLYTDLLYLGPAIRTARPLIDAGAKVYFYEFSYKGDLNRESASLTVSTDGAARGDIVGYLFTHYEQMPVEDSEEEQKVDLITDLWSSFIQTGKPLANGITWHELERSEDENEEWLSIGANVTLKQGVHVDRLALWTDLYDEFYIDRNPASTQTPVHYLLSLIVLLIGIPKLNSIVIV